MRTRITVFLLMAFLLNTSFCNSQTDSTSLTYNEFLSNIIRYHPIALKADLKRDIAATEWLAAKGNLDPILTSNWNEKNFDGKLYYRQFQGKLQIPTKLGIDVVAGYENTSGTYLNPENKTDNFGLWNVGVEANVLQGLLTNKRRAAFKQAAIMQDMAENERRIILNELLYEASLGYLQWQQYHYAQEAIKSNIALANTYFENTKTSFESGEKTAMDTIESFMMYQDVLLLSQKNNMTLLKARQNIENYLWYEELPVTLAVKTRPENYDASIFKAISNNAIVNIISNHPMILEKINKQSYYEIEQKLKREKLKPKLKLKYNPLLATSDNGVAPRYSISDFKWGFDFSMPILLRSERAAIKKGELKLEEISLEIRDKKNELLNKIEASLQQQEALREQLILLSQNIAGYKQLLDGESEKFKYGESSVFLLNKRQEKYLSSQLKLIELNVKYQKELLTYWYYTNGLIEQ